MAMGLAEGQGKNWPKAKNALAEGQSPPQELEVSPRSGLYLLVDSYYLKGLMVYQTLRICIQVQFSQRYGQIKDRTPNFFLNIFGLA